MNEQFWEWVDQYLADGDWLFAFMPLLELRAGFLDCPFGGNGFISKALVELDKSVMSVAKHSDCISLKVCNMLDLKILVDLPERRVVVFQKTFVDHFLLVLLVQVA